MWKTHPNPCSGTGLNYYLLNTREALPNRRHTSRQAVSGPILSLEETYRAGGTSGHVPRAVLPASEEQPERKGHLKRFTRGQTLLAWTKRLLCCPFCVQRCSWWLPALPQWCCQFRPVVGLSAQYINVKCEQKPGVFGAGDEGAGNQNR